jgi:hypothetical protein
MQLSQRFTDRLEPLGIAGGAFIVLAALGTLLGQPWTTNPNLLAVGLQLVGVVAAIAVGTVLISLSWTGRE